MKSKLSKSFLGFLWGVFVLSFPLRSVMAQEQLWHRVEKDTYIYDIWVDCSEQLNGRFIGQGDIAQQKINYLRITQNDVPVQDFSLIKEIICIAENAAYMANNPFAGFINENHLDVRTRAPVGYDYTYYALPTHCDLPFITPLLDNYSLRKGYYIEALIESIAQPKRYEELNASGQLTTKLENLVAVASAGQSISSGTKSLISKITDTSLIYIDGNPIEIQAIKGTDGQKLFDIMQGQLSSKGMTLEFLNKLAYGFQVVGYAGKISSGAFRKMFIESCIILPESMQRLEAVEFYLSSLSEPDPALFEAFAEVKQYYEYSKANYDNIIVHIIEEAAQLDNIVTLGNLLKATLSQYKDLGYSTGTSKILSGWFLAVTWSLEFWEELNHANAGIMAATIERGIGNHFVSFYSPEIDLNDVLSYTDIKYKSAFPSIQTYGGYLFYQNIADNIKINLFNPYDWPKYIDYLEPYVGGTNPSQKVEFFEERANYCLNWGSVEWVNNLQFLGPSFNVGSDSIYDALAKLAMVPDFEIPDENYVSITPSELSLPGVPINIEVSVLNKGISAGDAQVRITFDALYASFASGQTSSIINIAPQNFGQFNFTIDTSNFLPDNYNVTIEVINRSGKAEIDGSNNIVSFGYSVGGTKPAFLKEFPLIEIAQSIPGREYQFLLDIKKYFYDDNPEDVTIEARGYSNLVIDIDPNGMAYIRGKHNWFGSERVTFIIKDPTGAEDYQEAYITITPVENEMSLVSGIVTPDSGISGTIYEYKVNYKDLAGRFPQVRSVYVNGIPHTMKWSGTPIKDGSEFTFTRVGREIPTAGDNTYHFIFGYDEQIVRYPQQSVLEGPDISIYHDVAVAGFQINPDKPRQDQLSNLSFRVENLGSVIESDLIARLFVDGNEVNSISVENLCAADSSKVITFEWIPPVRDDAHEYQLTVLVDVVGGEVNTANNSQILTLTVKPEYGHVTGWVFDQFNNPIEGAYIRVLSSSPEDYGSTKTEHDGWYILDGLMPGTYTLEALKDGQGSALKTNVIVHSLQETENQIFNIYPTGMSQITSGRYLQGTALSPNGNKLAFVQTLGSGVDSYRALHRINVDGSGLTRMCGPDKPALDVVYGYPKFSPDGTKILFEAIASNNNGRGIWIANANGNGSDAYKVIPSVANSHYGMFPTWSPDGQKIAYIKVFTDTNPYTYKLSIYDIATQTENYLKDGSYWRLDWSPDGSWIACDGSNFIIDASTGEEVPISSSFETPCWLPDSSGVIYHSNRNIWLYYLATEETVQITFDPEIEYYASVPRNVANKLAFISNKGFPEIGDYGLFTMPFSPPNLYFTQVSARPDPFTPNSDAVDDVVDISYSINKPAYVTVKVHDSQGNYIKTLVGNELQEPNSYNLHWDGKNQYGLAQNAEVYFYRLDMHDSNEIAIPAHGRVSMIKDTNYIGSGLYYGRWSHQGDKIVYLEDLTKSIYICDSNDFSNKQLVPTPYDVWYRPAWSRDDQQIVFPSYSHQPDNWPQIAKINLDGTGYQDLTSYVKYGLGCGKFPIWSPVEDIIVFEGIWWNETQERRYWNITKMNSDGTGLVKIDDYDYDPGGTNGYPAISHDGSKIAWMSDRSGNDEIWLMNLDGSNKEQFTNNPYRDVYPEFTPDGKRLLFGSKRHTGSQGSLELWTQPFDDSDDPRCLYKGGGFGVPSPDGSRILLWTGEVVDLFVSLTKGTIEGKVEDEEYLMPIENAVITLKQDSNDLMQTVTNNNGAYQFLNVEPDIYAVEVNASGYITQTEVAESLPWHFTRNIDFTLTTVPTVRVTSFDTNEVLQGTVQLFGEGTSSNTTQIVYQYAIVNTYSEMSAMQSSAQNSPSYNWITIGTSDQYHPLQWDVSTLSSGEYLIRSIAQDEFGNADSSPGVVSITIDRTAPVASISNVDNNDIISGIVELEAIAADNDVGSIRFDYKLHNDVIWRTIDSCYFASCTILWDTQNLFYNEVYDLRAVATDIYGNEDQAPMTISVTVAEPVLPEQCDFNNDGVVNFIDFAHFASQWLRTDCNETNLWCEQCDLNKMGTVNYYDLMFFAENWLWQALEADIDNSGTVNLEDLRLLANKWLWVGSPGIISEDIIQDGTVNFLDFAALAKEWLSGTE